MNSIIHTRLREVGQGERLLLKPTSVLSKANYPPPGTYITGHYSRGLQEELLTRGTIALLPMTQYIQRGTDKGDDLLEMYPALHVNTDSLSVQVFDEPTKIFGQTEFLFHFNTKTRSVARTGVQPSHLGIVSFERTYRSLLHQNEVMPDAYVDYRKTCAVDGYSYHGEVPILAYTYNKIALGIFAPWSGLISGPYCIYDLTILSADVIPMGMRNMPFLQPIQAEQAI